MARVRLAAVRRMPTSRHMQSKRASRIGSTLAGATAKGASCTDTLDASDASSGARQVPSLRTQAAMLSPAIAPNTVELATPLPPSRFAPCTPPVSSPAAKRPSTAVRQSAPKMTPPIM